MEEEKGVRYDAKKLALEVFRKWQVLVVITLVVAVVFCVISITGSTDVVYEAAEGFSITYPELSYTPSDPAAAADVEEVLNFMLAEQQRKVARTVDTLTNTAYINLYGALEEDSDASYKLDELKSNITLALGNSNTTLTATVKARSAKDAVFMLDNLEQQVKSAIGSGETAGYSVQLTYKNSEDTLNAMYTVEEGGVVSIVVSVVEGLVIGFVVAVIILLIWSAAFMRVTYAEDITMQTDYPVLATVYAGENNVSEAVIKSALVRGESDNATYVMGVSKSASDLARAWAEREGQSCEVLYVDFDDESGKGIAQVLDGEEPESVVTDGKLGAGSGLDIYGKRDSIAELFVRLREKYSRVIVSGYFGGDVRSELLATFAGDTALVVDEGYSVKKLIKLEETYKSQGRKVEGVILRRKNARKSK